MPKRSRISIAVLSLATPLLALAADPPQYRITDLGVIAPSVNSGAQGISDNGAFISGRNTPSRTSSSPWSATIWTADGSRAPQLGASITGLTYGQAFAVNNTGVAVGQLALNANGQTPVPVMWDGNGRVTQLALPSGFTIGRAYDLNNGGLAAGSIGTDTYEYAALYNTKLNTVSTITATASDGAFMRTAYGVSDTGLAVGTGALNFGATMEAVIYDSNKGLLNVLPMLGTPDGSTAGAISGNGQYVVGSSSTGAKSQPFIWSLAGGTVAPDLPSGYSSGQLVAVNDSGTAIGSASSAYAAAWLYEDGVTYNLADLVVNPTGWNFRTTTTFAANAIGDDGTIVGWASYGGAVHAYMMTAVPEPQSWALMLGGLLAIGSVARRRKT